ncbi:nucleoside-diphosphate kinase [Nanoarchaeota archaeon]
MTEENVFVFVKPDAMIKGIYGIILDDIASSGLKLVGAKLVRVTKELAEKHYEVHKGKPFYEGLIKHITGEFHVDKVMALVYKGDNAIKRMRELAGATHPEKAGPTTLRGKFGRVTAQDVMENVVHVSDAPETAETEIKLWFSPSELTEEVYPTKKETGEKIIWA